MSAPRLEIDLKKIFYNAQSLVERLRPLGISVTGVTKAVLGHPEIANALLRAGVLNLGDSRLENIDVMHRANVDSPMILLRSPMVSQLARVVKSFDISFNTEWDVIRRLSIEAKKAQRIHSVVLMVEMGDLREGIMLEDLENTVGKILELPNILLKGIGTNLACRNGISPDIVNMGKLSELANKIDKKFGIVLETVSGGNSANLNWAFGGNDIGRINNLRLGEAILLGVEPLYRQPIEGLYTDAITLIAEVIESKIKPTLPWGNMAQSTFDDNSTKIDKGIIKQTILAIGRQDIDHTGIKASNGIEILEASSDHLIVNSGNNSIVIGNEIVFNVNYSAFLRAMTSPFVSKVMK